MHLLHRTQSLAQAAPYGAQYGNWSGCYNATDPMTRECFWTDPLAKKMYKNHMLTMVSRLNTVNGRLWRCVICQLPRSPQETDGALDMSAWSYA